MFRTSNISLVALDRVFKYVQMLRLTLFAMSGLFGMLAIRGQQDLLLFFFKEVDWDVNKTAVLFQTDVSELQREKKQNPLLLKPKANSLQHHFPKPPPARDKVMR